MRVLKDKELIEAYIRARNHKMDPLFIVQLREELERRGIRTGKIKSGKTVISRKTFNKLW